MLYSIGYEGLRINQFLDILREKKIEMVIDVREFPLSRKQGFSKNPLSFALNLAGLGYEYMSALGCPKDIRAQYKEDKNWGNYQRDFNHYLKTQHAALKELFSLSSRFRCALFCFEADFNFCHRALIASAMQSQYGIETEHINTTVNHTHAQYSNIEQTFLNFN